MPDDVNRKRPISLISEIWKIELSEELMDKKIKTLTPDSPRTDSAINEVNEFEDVVINMSEISTLEKTESEDN